MHPDDHVRVRQEWLDWLPSQMPFETQFRLRLRRDEFQWMVSRAKPHFDSHGCVDKWYGVITEVQIQCNPPVLSAMRFTQFPPIFVHRISSHSNA